MRRKEDSLKIISSDIFFYDSVFLGLLLLTLIQANDKYQPTQTIEAIGNKNKVAFSHDDSWMLAYSES